jgi:hypothetical protein
MSNESHIDFKEFDSNRACEVERHYGLILRKLDIALDALEYIQGDDESKCLDNNCGCRPCSASKALEEIRSQRIEKLDIQNGLITKGVYGDLRLNELGALAKGGFSVTLCDSELNYEGEGKTPLEAILSAIKSKDNYDPTPYCSACGAMEIKKCHCGPIADNE